MKVNREVKHYPMYYGGVKQVYPNVPLGSPIYAKTVVVGNLIFCSGMTAQDVETGKVLVHDMAGQMLVVLDKVKAALEEAGSSMNNIVKTLMLLKNLKDYQVMRKTELEYYQKHAPLLVEQPPASTFMQPASLARPEFLVEMDVIAVVSR
jgi:2-iminobutanoate/2-iminopropanoate deaminase